MTRLSGHGDEKYTTGTRLGSSRERDWRGLLVESWRHRSGDLGAVEPRDTEVIVLIDGRLKTRRRGDGRVQFHDAAPGTVWLCPAGIREDMIHLYGDITESLHMYLPASPLSDTALRELDLDPDTLRLNYEGGFRDPLIEEIARAVRRELNAPGPGDRLLVETLSRALSVHILRTRSNRGRVPLTATTGALDRRRLDRVVELIEANLAADLSLDRLAGEARLSPFHFARAFKAATGRPPHRYVTERRVKRAMTMLSARTVTLAETALACGFSSQSHFTRAFRQVTGTTPGAWRASAE